MFYLFEGTHPITGKTVFNVRRKIDIDVVETRPVDDLEYLAWVAEGNTPEEWNPNGDEE